MCRVLADPDGDLADLRKETSLYPSALGAALVEGLWEADFAVQLARYGAAGTDPAYAAGCLFRAVGVACQALHGHEGQWLINEKGMVASAGWLCTSPRDFAVRAQRLLGDIGESTRQIEATVADAAALIEEVKTVVGR
ncbi:hypothetical protein [Nonomuraea sp. NPDC049400]|uniref:hypothetical protein n=1 Tax=Nonomuraea sp. NPDC049400 TaxID=3364352 RepID=UPI0037AFC8D9